MQGEDSSSRRLLVNWNVWLHPPASVCATKHDYGLSSYQINCCEQWVPAVYIAMVSSGLQTPFLLDPEYKTVTELFAGA